MTELEILRPAAPLPLRPYACGRRAMRVRVRDVDLEAADGLSSGRADARRADAADALSDTLPNRRTQGRTQGRQQAPLSRMRRASSAYCRGLLKPTRLPRRLTMRTFYICHEALLKLL
eukprot:4911325-Pleurochrysis_carterae.AAC.2